MEKMWHCTVEKKKEHGHGSWEDESRSELKDW